jgi:hypothetical protein
MKTSVKRPIITRPFKRKRFEWWMIFAYIILPFYKLWQGLLWLYEILFCETKQSDWNGVFGPGGTTYSYHEFSWGKLSFVIALIALILVIIYII